MTIQALEGISASSVERYLTVKGWVRDPNFKNPKIMVFIHSNYKTRVALPSSEKYQDFYITLKEVLKTISALSQVEVSEIENEILALCYDRMEFRIISSSTDDGKLPLEYAANCIEGLKDLILYSACAEQTMQPICWRATNTAKSVLSNFKLAQTGIGSFVINVETQVIDICEEQVHWDLAVEKPLLNEFEHKVVERISTAIQQIDNIVERVQSPTELAETAYQTGITANMCDALLKLRPMDGDAKIETRIKYSPVMSKAAENRIVTLNDHHFWATEEISKIYRDREICRDVVLTGYITLLSRQNENENIVRLITIYEGKSRIVRMELSPEDNRKACDAFRDLNEVEVAGELDMSDRLWILTKITYFHIIDNS